MGTADLAYWRDRLRTDDLIPAESDDGRAQLMIVGAEGKYLGVRFRELSASVVVCSPAKRSPQDAAYLVRAFNSSRFFAFCERAIFSTPYYAGDVRVSVSVPASVQLLQGGATEFSASMGPDVSQRAPSHCGEACWEGPIFLPHNRPGGVSSGKLFWARLQGLTRTYPFLPGTDTVTIKPAPGNPLCQALESSSFLGKEWIVREDASHAKSKTYRRTEMFPT